MSIQVALKHRTWYRYDRPVSLGPQVIQLRPAPHCRTPILSYSLDIEPADHVLKWQLDPHANYLARVFFPHKTSEFIVEVNLVADLTPINPFDFFLEPGYVEWPFSYAPDLARDLRPYLDRETPGPLFQAFLKAFLSSQGQAQSQAGRTFNSSQKKGTVGLLLDLNSKVRNELAYNSRLEAGVQSCEETLSLHSGSCRDSAWLLVQAMRHLGIAARFVSGYLIQLENKENPVPDHAAFHAWAEAFLPGAGWVGLDATSGLLTGEGHIPLASTPSPSKAAAIGGTVEPAGVEFDFSMSVSRLNSELSLSKPFSEEEWANVEKLASRIDADLEAQDVRLTMGGEPTFVGIDEPESPQWNIEALGTIKRTRGLDIIRGIRDEMAPGALLHYGQGKWYPGEPLPRWALGCYWRKDGVPVWQNPELIAHETEIIGYTTPDALRFAQALTRRLEASLDNLLPAYNPSEAPDADAHLAGYLLPIRRRQWDGRLRWSSQLWFSRPEQLTLIQGDSPIGLRLSTDVIPWVAPDDLDYDFEPAPLEDKAKLPPAPLRRPELFAADPAPDPLPPLSSTAENAAVLIRTALCVEARNGRLHVFLPFSSQLADCLDMVAAVEDTCLHLGVKIWVEGYTPPSDPRLTNFTVTPDPGVLEINLPPAKNWPELEAIHGVLFDEAAKHRLVAEKFAMDGRHAPTGGGSHIVVGGASLLDSPFLRRPDVLRSMVAFWQNHPSLSYLFSGQYVGPTSQCPRVDEARLDSLYELEVAFRNLPPADNCPAWVVDALFHHLLIDVTGNSHRAEFCIDKLYPPEGQGLRLGLLELRAFEMAPNLRMCLLQSLLVRALIASFWKTPFEGGLIRWGANLHDRFMLPHFVAGDFHAMLAHLRRSGLGFDEKWFASQLEFRFPKIGSISADGVQVEIRHALEPWNVLAEETVSGSTVRSVDSSMERLQIKVSGLPDGLTGDARYIVACNGRRVPVTPTGEPGVAIAGVRFRARRLAETLHPTVPVHAPLFFDLIDTWHERTLAQCSYYVSQPDGQPYSSRPANAAEAAERRAERFRVTSGTPFAATVPPEEINPVFPMTLDLRVPKPSPAAVFAHVSGQVT